MYKSGEILFKKKDKTVQELKTHTNNKERYFLVYIKKNQKSFLNRENILYVRYICLDL